MRQTMLAGLLLAAGAATAAATLTGTDRTYLTAEAQGSMYEAQLSQLATAKASSPQVKQYAAMLVQDHTAYNSALQQLAQSQGVSLPAAMNDADSERLAQVQKLSGAEFDRAYVNEAKRINTEDAAKAERETQATSNPAIKSFLAQFKATDEKHKQAADALSAG